MFDKFGLKPTQIVDFFDTLNRFADFKKNTADCHFFGLFMSGSWGHFGQSSLVVGGTVAKTSNKTKQLLEKLAFFFMPLTKTKILISKYCKDQL